MRSPSTRLLTAIMTSGLTLVGAVGLAQEGFYHTSDAQLAPVPEGGTAGSAPCAQCQQGSSHVVYGGQCESDCDSGWGCCLLSKGKIYRTSGGWHPPQPNPIRRAPVVYQRYLPPTPYGGGPAWGVNNAPMVYQPTDTTQLGFYYHRVPTWLPNPQMIPPAPWPENYHSRTCKPKGCEYIPAGGEIIYDGSLSTPGTMEPTPATAPPAPAPAELDKSAANWNGFPVRS